MMINHGAVRAGKTYINNELFLQELTRARENAKKQGEKAMYILGAASSGTLQTNVLREIEDHFGINIRFDQFRNFTLCDVYVVTTFTGSVAGIRSIRGMTSYGAYVNEASLANKEVFDEIVKRCSGLGARIMLDTNPDHPNHWLKTDYIDKADGERIISNHFTLFDNDFLNDRYVENLLAATPSGMFTERGIYGRWVSGEGAVYTDFKPEVHFIDKAPNNIVHYFCGVDWGYDHYGVIVLCGRLRDGRVVMLREYAKQYKEIDWWVAVAKQLQQEFGERLPFYCDSARSEHVARFKREGLHAHYAHKSILAGIEQVAKLFKQEQLFVVDEIAEQFKNEIYQYVWNERTGKPIKQHDDVLDALRYAIYSEYVLSQNKKQSKTNKLKSLGRL
ncbi:terminase [Dolosigranulum pigrum]|nr:PBSX family phage terminase large subunit [Dolosigranulum pigrum]RAN53927.1 terminase [Dolosigranulum pigrum]